MVNQQDGQLNLAFSALAHPIRRRIVARLAGGDATVAELARPHRVSAPAISKHLRILERAGLMSRRKRGRMHHCRLVPGRMQEAERWLEHYRRFWAERLDRLEMYLQELQRKERRHGSKST
jgi:DNA-binding transcriptional ArsR family regulator